MKVDREDRWLLIVLREYQKGGGSQGTANSCFSYSVVATPAMGRPARQPRGSYSAMRLGAFPYGLPCAQTLWSKSLPPALNLRWTWFCPTNFT